MKKFENSLNDLPGYGKTILPKKAAGNRLPVAGNGIRHRARPSSYWPLAAGHLLLIGENGTITALKNPIALVFSRRQNTDFDISKKPYGGLT